MKKLLKLKLSLFVGLLLFLNYSNGQECNIIQKQTNFTSLQLSSKFNEFLADPGFKTLYNEATKKGFLKITEEKASWGFSGQIQDGSTVTDVVFCAYDFITKDGKQMCSMIWKKIGKKIYKAYIVFPPGEKNMDKALEGAQEWYADANNQVQLAQSWRSCFRRCVLNNCPGWCAGVIATCAGVTVTISIATGGIGVPAAIALFAGCAGISCATCLAVCAVGCP